MEIKSQQLIDFYKTMVTIRKFELKAAELFAAGKMPGFVHLYVGEEAVATGVCANLNDKDFITSTHRGHGHLIAKGGKLELMMAELYGKATGYCKGKGGSMQTASSARGSPSRSARPGPANTRGRTTWRSASTATARPTAAPSTRP